VVTGARGQLGTSICRALGERAIGVDLPELDITRRHAVVEYIGRIRPAAIINCAAYTAVDCAEASSEACFAVNATAVSYLADAANAVDCALIQISTDYVFHGDASRNAPFVEDDSPSPAGVYAISKHTGETAAAKARRCVIARTCGLYSHHGDNFVRTMLKLGSEREVVRVVNDQFCCPSNVVDVANAVIHLTLSGAAGVYHVTNTGATTWFDLAVEIYRRRRMNVTVEPISTGEYCAPAPRPRYSVLDTSKYHRLPDAPPMPTVMAALYKHLAEL